MTVKLHRALYTRQAIQDAAVTFADYASFALRADGDHFVVEVSDVADDVDGDVVAEFCNFALANTAVAVKSRQANEEGA